MLDNPLNLRAFSHNRAPAFGTPVFVPQAVGINPTSLIGVP